ncbi:MAG TPA: hypothetical protein P5186_16655 [Candidatus Paceibacterota bacterium]|nr:hypothetical protein [Verrucomicrobiota bacterium]HRY49681.1 hypothetical protein [Candidatus Paceibacterota bacterium]
MRSFVWQGLDAADWAKKVYKTTNAGWLYEFTSDSCIITGKRKSVFGKIITIFGVSI